jgi:hypothetical protein
METSDWAKTLDVTKTRVKKFREKFIRGQVDGGTGFGL